MKAKKIQTEIKYLCPVCDEKYDNKKAAEKCQKVHIDPSLLTIDSCHWDDCRSHIPTHIYIKDGHFTFLYVLKEG